MIDKAVRYFDLQAGQRPSQPTGYAKSKKRFPVVPQYVALVLGIIAQPFLTKYAETQVWETHALPGWIVFSAIAGLVIFPAVYTHSLDPRKPLFVQLCVIFAAGIGWQSVLQVAGKGISS